MKIFSVFEQPELTKSNGTQSNVAMLNVTKPQVNQFRKHEEPEKPNVSRVTRHEDSVPAVIKVVSVGGGGGNALNRMIENNIKGVQFIAINTDLQDLNDKSMARVKLHIGSKTTGRHGAGGVPEIGEKAASENQEEIAGALKGADMVFIAAGMGGGTGTGAAHIVAKIAKEQGALTIGVVTTPFEFEGRYKMKLAEEGIAKLRLAVDALIIIPNQHLFKIINNTTLLDAAFLMADKVLCDGVQGIAELITKTGFQNVDFADVVTIMKGKGDALMGIGIASGENRAAEAVKNAIDNPLLEDTNIDGATGVLINIACPNNITFVEINNIIKTVKDKCDPEVHLISGFRKDPKLDNSIQVTVIATGFHSGRFTGAVKSGDKKPAASGIINYDDFVQIKERFKKSDPLGCLPPKDYQDDLDVPSVIRKHHFQREEISMDKAENG